MPTLPAPATVPDPAAPAPTFDRVARRATDDAAATAPHAILREVFGYDSFRGRQGDIIGHVLGGGDALVLMPTGGGKSLCYQIPAIARQRAGHGVTLVISPLIALMHDQVSALHEAGVAAAFLNSSQDWAQAQAVERQLLAGELTLLYAAPERVTTPRFLELLDALHARGQLALFAIDEAHCVSQWGHDFRPEYRQLSVLHQRWPDVPRIALTATADALTRADIIGHLHLHGAAQFVSSFDRPNIRYHIVEKKDATRQLLQFIAREHAGDAGVVYCQSRRRAEELADTLCDHGITALPYHAGLPAAERQRNQDRFLREDGIVMCATIAFGMGIDKPDVRFVAHVDMPKNIEGYYQETGRAGRDGLPATAWMAYGLQDVVNQRRMIDESPADESFRQVMRGKLEALLALAESTGCRRARLLAYFGEEMAPRPNPADTSSQAQAWPGTPPAAAIPAAIHSTQDTYIPIPAAISAMPADTPSKNGQAPAPSQNGQNGQGGRDAVTAHPPALPQARPVAHATMTVGLPAPSRLPPSASVSASAASSDAASPDEHAAAFPWQDEQNGQGGRDAVTAHLPALPQARPAAHTTMTVDLPAPSPDGHTASSWQDGRNAPEAPEAPEVQNRQSSPSAAGQTDTYPATSLDNHSEGAYTPSTYQPYCGNCDNCLNPPAVWDATEAARMLLSAIYRVQQASGIRFGAGHIMDIVRGRTTDKMAQYGHERLPTFGVGTAYSEAQLRSVLRQLIATGAVVVDASAYNTLRLCDAARPILRGQQRIHLRQAPPATRAQRALHGRPGRGERPASAASAAAGLDAAGQQRFAALRTWRAEAARASNLPAYVIFHDSTLAAIAARNPQTPADLARISGIGAARLERYGDDVLRVCAEAGR